MASISASAPARWTGLAPSTPIPKQIHRIVTGPGHQRSRSAPRSGAGWRGEDGVGSDAPPDDVRLAGHTLGSVTEGGAAVVVPRHLEHASVGLHPFDTQAWPERPVRGRQVGHESLHHDLAEHGPLPWREILPVSLETRERLERRHQGSAASASR